MRVYADNAATMRIRESAYNAMLNYLRGDYGNPSSIHADGISAAKTLGRARSVIAECIGANVNEISFTSGATESNNQAILTAIEKGEKTGHKHIVSTAIEHHSILEPLKRAKELGFDVTLVYPNKNGIVGIDDIQKVITSDTCFVSVMAVNNEVGTIQPIGDIAKYCRRRGIIFHTDATQAIGHIPIDVKKDKIDILSFSAHKFGGATGAGVLYCRNGIKPYSLLLGGNQERCGRAGTENVPAIIAMAEALKESFETMRGENEKVSLSRNYLLDNLLGIPGSHLNGDREKRLANNINIRFDGVEGEALVLLLSQRGIMVSSGSACSSGNLDASHVLKSMGLSNKQAHESIRITLSQENNQEEIDYMISNIKSCVNYLRNLSKWKI